MILVNKNGQLIEKTDFFSRIICFFWGHKYKLARRVNRSISELRCLRCRNEFAINSEVESILPLDKDLIRIHNEILINKP